MFTRLALDEALPRGGCVVCQSVRLSERRSVWSFLYEGMMSPLVRQDFLEGGGFCARHLRLAKEIEEQTWQAGGIGLAILCEQLLRQWEREISESGETPGRGRGARWQRHNSEPALAPGQNCLFCRENRRKEQAVIEVLELLSEEEKYASAVSRDPLCLRHTQIALREWKTPERTVWLRELTLHRIEEHLRDLRTFIEKHDYQRRGEPLGQAADAVERAARLIAGLDAVASEDGRDHRENPDRLRSAR
ncbi:MAG TPA: DUF6062 family protein [Terriglobales bacterium]|nr:DUF6062 family protein [Terriglobales bacterium]